MGTRVFTLFTIATVLLACSQSPETQSRSRLGNGNALGGQDATVQSGKSAVTCSATALESPVHSGVAFNVQVRLTNGSLPFSIANFASSVSTETTVISGSIISGTAQTVTRGIVVTAAQGSGSCAFSVQVVP